MASPTTSPVDTVLDGGEDEDDGGGGGLFTVGVPELDGGGGGLRVVDGGGGGEEREKTAERERVRKMKRKKNRGGRGCLSAGCPNPGGGFWGPTRLARAISPAFARSPLSFPFG
ncbi:hypothetical protein CRG98_035197 [Punica granatum]|uniref:Uncharacterized protein n=1 Tax=Punica granatum TaxID=22663 RepID=A0A2I0IK88_PUNGR|nr:hypothetical protein CRG98_035197 [Punica granatum]